MRVSLLLAGLGLLIVPAARADTYCVGKPECSGTSVASIEAARGAVRSHDGPDRIEIGTGTFDGPLATFGEDVEIVGSGPGATIVNGSAATQAINLVGVNTSVSGLTVHMSKNNAAGVDLEGGTVTDVAVEAEVPDTPSITGVILRDGGTVRRVTVTLDPHSSPVNYGVTVTGEGGERVPTVIEDVNLTAGYAIDLERFNAPVAITRANLHGAVRGIASRGDAHVTATDVYANVEGYASGDAVYISDDGSTGPITFDLSHATLRASGASGVGVGARSNTGQTITVNVKDTAVESAGTYGLAFQPYGQTATVNVAFSAFEGDRVAADGPTVLGDGNQNTDYAPLNIDGNGLPTAGSVLIDHGSEAGGTDGDGDGVATRDIGAFEAAAKTSAAPAATAPFAPGPFGPQSVVVPGATPTPVPTVAPLVRATSKITKAGRTKVKGTASEGAGRVVLSIVRRKGKRCASVTGKGKFKKATCGKPRFTLVAKGTTTWSLKLPKKLRKGRYTITSRAGDGPTVETAFSKTAGNVRRLRVS